MKKLITIFTIFLFIISINQSHCQESNKHFKAFAQPSVTEVKAGDEFTIRLFMKMDNHWYTYSTKEQLSKEGIGPEPSDIFLLPEELIEVNGDISGTKPKSKFDKGFEMEIEYYAGQLVFDIPVKAKKDINFSNVKIQVGLFIQQCDTAHCIPPMEFNVNVESVVYDSEEIHELQKIESNQEPDTGGLESEETQSPPSVKTDDSDAEKKVITTTERENAEKIKDAGVFSYVWYAMGFGLLGLLTPCVYPMIPITVSFFTKRSGKKGLRDAFVYVIGIISTFTALGILVAAISGPAGLNQMASSWIMNTFITLLFLVFALNLFGSFEIMIPTSIINKLNTKSQKSDGILGVLLMGLTFSLTSFTCTVPFVGLVLADTAQGEWFYPIIGMMSYSFVFAIPFFFLALFPSLLKSMPKSGGWMNNIKVVMGFLEVAFAMKFLSNVDLALGWGIMPRELFLASWIAAGALIVVYLLGFYKMKLDTPVEKVSGVRIMFTIVFTTITIWLVSGLFGSSLGQLDAFLPPPKTIYEGLTNTDEAHNKTDLHFKDYETALAKAKELNKPLFVDFTGVTCTNCRYMETNMFGRPEISKRLDQFVQVQLWTDRDNPNDKANQKMQLERFNTVTLPLYVLMTPDEEKIETMSFTNSEQDFREFLDKGLDHEL